MRKSLSAKHIVCFVVAQLLIVVVFLTLFYQSLPVNQENIRQISGTIEKTTYEKVIKEYRFSIYIDSECYQFSNLGTAASYSNRELYESIKEGEEITIKYYEKFGFMGKVKWVIDARTNTEVYRTVEEYNTQHKGIPTLVIILVLLFEIIWILALSIDLVLFGKKVYKREK